MEKKSGKTSDGSQLSARHILAFLQNFESENSPIAFGTLQLDLIEEADRILALNTRDYYAPINPFSLGQTKFKLSGTYSAKLDRKGQLPKFAGLQDLLLTLRALRLYKAGDVGILWVRDIELANEVFGDTVWPWKMYQANVCSRPYRLTPSDISPLHRLLGILRKFDESDQMKSLAVSFRRFDLTYNREYIEDRIIDLVVALENTLLAKKADELSYRLALRGAALLRHIRRPVETSSLLKGLYKVRSEIVHNGERLESKKIQNIANKIIPPIKAIDLPQHCQDVVREILREYVLRLRETRTLKEVNEELEQEITKGLEALPQRSVG